MKPASAAHNCGVRRQLLAENVLVFECMRIKATSVTAYVLIAAGLVMLSWYGSQRLDVFRIQRAASRQFDERKNAGTEAERKANPGIAVNVRPHAGDPVGRVEISRVHLSVMILEGTTEKVLRAAAGHVEGTALPDVTGNVAISGHRDTLFRPLRKVQLRDEIVLTTSYGTFHYVIESTEIVDPTAVAVLDPTKTPQLTLITCYPFAYVGAAPKRFIVHARQTSRN